MKYFTKIIAFLLLFDPEHIPQPGELIWGRPGAVPKLEAGFCIFLSFSLILGSLEARARGSRNLIFHEKMRIWHEKS